MISNPRTLDWRATARVATVVVSTGLGMLAAVAVIALGSWLVGPLGA